MTSRLAEKPPQPAFKDAKALQYQRVPQVISQMKGCRACGYPFVFGFTVYASFESDTVAQTDVVPMPAPNERVLGGHAVVAVGYDDSTQSFIGRTPGVLGGEWAAISQYPLPT